MIFLSLISTSVSVIPYLAFNMIDILPRRSHAEIFFLRVFSRVSEYSLHIKVIMLGIWLTIICSILLVSYLDVFMDFNTLTDLPAS